MSITVRQALTETADRRGLRASTVLSYQRLLTRAGLIDEDASLVTRERALAACWTIENPNTRRSAVVAVRAVLGLDLRIPKAIPRRYDLPDEDTLRLALMLSGRHEVRGLLMAYCGLRIGEACAITAANLDGDRLRVDRQVQTLHRTGLPTTTAIGPTKSAAADVPVPWWLAQRVADLHETVKPDAVREAIRRGGAKVGIVLTPHELRHWCATTLLARGVPLITVSRILRHSDVATTLRTYAQASDDTEMHRAFG